MADKSAVTRSWSDSSVRSGFFEVPFGFKWCQTNSSGLVSGAYVGRKCSSRFPRVDWT